LFAGVALSLMQACCVGMCLWGGVLVCVLCNDVLSLCGQQGAARLC
jgi:hypothetical protein